jgi:enoyl-CoA hydratase/carnithine racemase
MPYDTIEYVPEEEEMRATIRLDRPDAMNALSVDLLEELNDALLKAEANNEIRAIVITGNGDAFSAGYDLQAEDDASTTGGSKEDPIPSADDLLDAMESLSTHIKTIWGLNKPVIAAVNGHCLAGGSDLAMITDIVIASEDATFGYPGQRVSGHPPALTYPFFMGIHQAKELLMTGKTIDADRALQMGIFNRVVPNDELLDEAYAEVDAIKKVPGNGVRLQKHSINSVVEQQGFSGTLKNSEFLDTLAHMMDVGQEYYRFVNEDDYDGMGDTLQWMNERDKSMREVKD